MKTIRTAANLTINGAPSVFEKPLHVGRPNIGDREAFLKRINQCLTNNGRMVQEFQARIANRLGVKHCVAMGKVNLFDTSRSFF